MTAFEEYIYDHLERTDVYIGNGYVRFSIGGLTVTQYWFDPQEIAVEEEKDDERRS
jgi:hypothetical protein